MVDSTTFYTQQSEPNKGCFLALRKILLDSHPLITETTKYGMPCFCYKSKPIWYLWKEKKGNVPYILFVDGNCIEHAALEQGSRSRMKTLTIDPYTDLDIKTINLLLEQSIQRRLGQ